VANLGSNSEQRMLGLSLVHRYLAPDESLAEVLFGLIMALTITAGARLFAEGGQFDLQRLVLATVGATSRGAPLMRCCMCSAASSTEADGRVFIACS